MNEDQNLVLAAREGDVEAFAELVKKYWPRILQTCASKLWNKGVAEDLAQQALLNIWKTHERLDPDGCVGAYFVTVARNACLSWLRRENRLGPLESIEGEDGEISGIIDRIQDPGPDPANRVLFKLSVDRTMQQLTDAHRRLIEMWLLEGFSVAEIAQDAGCTEQNIRYHLKNATDRFREYFRKEWGGDYGRGGVTSNEIVDDY